MSSSRFRSRWAPHSGWRCEPERRIAWQTFGLEQKRMITRGSAPRLTGDGMRAPLERIAGLLER